MAANDPLLQPFDLKGLAIRNRLMSTAHEPAYSEDGLPKARYRRYHEEKAKGGIGLTMFGGSSVVDRDSPPAFGNLELWRDEIVPWLGELSEAVHGHGAALMCQITHLGRRTNWNKADWLPVLAPSPIREPAHRAFPKEIEDFEIARVTGAYAAAAERCKAGGVDGVEIECYGHLLDAFWSPAWNKRTDDYGGSLDNRMRFADGVLAAIREAVGPDYVVGVRMVVDEDLEGGLSRKEGLEIAGRLARSGRVDFVNVIKGHIDTDEGLSHVIPGAGARSAPHLELAGAVRQLAGVPVFHAARIADVPTARHAVAEGLLDMVGMTRPHMADPHIGVKVARGEEERIRPCVGVGYCIDRIYGGGDALCIHNPATGREGSLPHMVAPADGPARRVVVVGAGPAGLEAARVCALRGHRVTVLEAASKPGGQVRIAASLARRREMIGIVDWLAAECVLAGAEIRYDTYAEAEDVLAEEPEVVVVATGGVPNTGFLDEGEALATTSWDILSGQARPAGTALLFDDNGAHPGASCAEHMAAAGTALEFVTPERTILPDIGGTNYPAYFKAFAEHGVRLTVNERLRAVRREGNKLIAVLWNEYARRETTRKVDQVVVEHGTLPMDEIYFALRPLSANLGETDLAALVAGRPQTLARNSQGTFQLFRVGDAVASRNLHAAIHDSLRLCMAL